MSGREFAKNMVFLDTATVAHADATTSPDESSILINVTKHFPDGVERHRALLFGPNLSLRWEKRFDSIYGSNARFEKDGTVVLTDGDSVQVGRFSGN